MTLQTLIDRNMPIGTFITQYPELTTLLIRHHVDFCCGGHRSLDLAIETDANNQDAVWTELNEALQTRRITTEITYEEFSTDELIQWILTKHHAYLKSELPTLSELIFKVLHVHGIKHPELFRIHQVYSHLKTELEMHMVKEETLLFPKLQDAVFSDYSLIETLEHEHDGAGNALKELSAIMNSSPLQEDACTSYTLLYDKLKVLILDMYNHVHLENNVLFPRFRAI
jgi:regulator of cell morphogenesis and NO signaling